MQSNQTTRVSRTDIEPFSSLIYFDLAQNPIGNIDSELFFGSSKLEYLNFNGNKIMTVGFGLLDSVKDASDVYFMSNSCINLHFDSSSRNSLSHLKLQLAMF